MAGTSPFACAAFALAVHASTGLRRAFAAPCQAQQVIRGCGGLTRGTLAQGLRRPGTAGYRGVVGSSPSRLTLPSPVGHYHHRERNTELQAVNLKSPTARSPPGRATHVPRLAFCGWPTLGASALRPPSSSLRKRAAPPSGYRWTITSWRREPSARRLYESEYVPQSFDVHVSVTFSRTCAQVMLKQGRKDADGGCAVDVPGPGACCQTMVFAKRFTWEGFSVEFTGVHVEEDSFAKTRSWAVMLLAPPMAPLCWVWTAMTRLPSPGRRTGAP